MTFSIVIPCHNGAGWLVRSLTSVAKQDYPADDYEVVLVDDASTDGSGVLAERLGTDFKNFSIVRDRESRGCGGARNAGTEVAKGDYLFYLDVDDYIAPDFLKKVKAAIDAKGSPDVVLFPYIVLRKNGTQMFPVRVSRIEDLANYSVAPWNHVCRRSLHVAFPEKVLSEDTAWHYEQFDRFDTYAVVDGESPCYYYDRTNDSAITDTVQWCQFNPHTMEQLAIGNAALVAGKRDQWISDFFRNYANMYDVRHRLRKPYIKDAWKRRFLAETSNLMTGHYCH